ncbi:glycoside hydrolase family 3 N-terminal domain-containing protein [Halogeometricum luteum]|uniref:beta-glucosidase n=1 Tax=Halogeometricum luteum TaxID=2950537 RepID=A0ABU2G3Y6_9EURY|nr:glycoside hydrolase family 3 N-terminal domain-containing protein [Halogeometricum sp. S3BR5-2]MDS0294924.1 glycoside hydrolase family 3 C-terminal domain-containing protein [Halogeometricum sp. S3BR5-2]
MFAEAIERGSWSGCRLYSRPEGGFSLELSMTSSIRRRSREALVFESVSLISSAETDHTRSISTVLEIYTRVEYIHMEVQTQSLLDQVSEEERAEVEERVETVLSELTLEQKVGQLNQLNADFATGTAAGEMDIEQGILDGDIGSVLNFRDLEEARRFQRLAVEESDHGIPLVLALDVIHGYRTIFPIPLGEAASWNPEVAELSARVAATEAAASGVHWTFAPSVDVSRDPRWGRVMEAAGEDPYLSATISSARVRGFQGDDLSAADTVLACAKHFIGYGATEAGREYNTVDISETNLHEIHLPPFEACLQAGVGSVMNAFNLYERIPASSNEELVDGLLRDRLDFEDLVVSDWNSFGELSTHGVAEDLREIARACIEAGSDVDMVSGAYVTELVALVESGVVDESLVDRAVKRLLTVKAVLGLFEDPYRHFDEERQTQRLLTDEHRQAARDVARESLVLLKNEADLLPLEDGRDVALVGGLAGSATDMLGAWRAEGTPDDVTTLEASLTDRVENLTYAEGCATDGTASDEQLETAVETVASADVAVVAVGERYDQSGEAASRAHIDLPGDQRALLEALVETGTPVAAVLFNGRPLAIDWEAEHVPAILEAWFPGVEAGPAIADVLLGEYNPSGRLPMSFPITEGQIPIYYDRLKTGRPAEDVDVDLTEPPENPAEKYLSRYLDIPNEPLYAFGHGESYTEFAYTDVSLDVPAITPEDSLSVDVTVENTGGRAGTEVVQVYVRDLVGSRARPIRELVRFGNVELEAGESETVSFELTTADLAFWTADEEYAAEPGEFEVQVGHAADDIAAVATFELVE